MITLLYLPYDSGHHAARMGRGPLHLHQHGAADRLRRDGHDVVESIIEVPSRDDALRWAAKFAAACRCAQEVREIMYDPES